MKKMETIVREHLSQYGLASSLYNHIKLWESAGLGSETPRANISVGYENNGKRKETTVVSFPDLEAAKTALASRTQIGKIIALGVRAMPVKFRPDVPEWIMKNHEADHVMKNMKRANAIAREGASGKDEEITDEEKPF